MRTLAVLMFFAAACGNGSATPPPPKAQPPKDAAVTDGVTALYVQMCAPCHGADAKGYKADHAPSLVNPTFLESASDEFIRRGIAQGRPGTSMAAYGKEAGGPLEPSTVDALVKWIRVKGPKVEPATLPPAKPGDVARGAELYRSGCQKCHGDQTSRGEGVHLANARFLETASDSFIRYAIAKGRPGTPMEPYEGKLSEADIDAVVTYVRTLAQAPVDAELPAPTGKEPLVINPGGKEPKFKPRADPGQEPRYVPIDQVKQALAEKRKLIIIDARPTSDWRRAHVEGAVSIPYTDMKRLEEVPQDVWTLAYCACPHHLSGIVVDELRKRGHKKAMILDEGVLEWHRRGYPMTVAQGVQPPPKEMAPPAAIPPPQHR